MPRRKVHPDQELLEQWKREGSQEMEHHYRDKAAGHPSIIMATAKAYIEGYIKGRLHQWRLEQEMTIFRSRLDQTND